MASEKGKIAFITGANRGLGYETARELGEKGVTVVLGSRDKALGEQAAEKLKSKGLHAIAFQFDVNNLTDHKKIYDYLEKNYGRLDILINNAGVMLDNATDGKNRTSVTSQDILRKTFDANFFNLIALTQTLLPLIKKSPSGRIVNLSSILGSSTLHANPSSPIYDLKAFAYNASKTALNAFTIHLAHELKDTSIKVNSAHPGWVKTDMGGPSAPMEVEEGGKTSTELALLPDNGPSGGFFHLGEKLPW
ncbi:MAG: SDR family oxidoreductase [Parachlamydiales bacterium]|jgi:NAD(P)-dependent dehydrogenase (short-subunit alcohol dehydrogenase family)